ISSISSVSVSIVSTVEKTSSGIRGAQGGHRITAWKSNRNLPSEIPSLDAAGACAHHKLRDYSSETNSWLEQAMGKLDRKVAIVTGASRGIGKAIAELFAQEGARVICSARTLHEGDHKLLEGSLEGTVAGIKQSGGDATAVTCDVSSEDECEKLVAETKRIYGPCDVLVNNAALTYFIPVKDYPTKRWMRSFQVNLHAPFILSKLVLQNMIPRKSGAILNISSGAAIGPGRGPYQ